MNKENCVRRIVNPHGLIEYQQGKTPVQIKLYSIIREGSQPFSKTETDFVGQATQKLIERREIDVLSGLGFAILTNGFMDLNFWGGKEVYLLNQGLYGLDREHILALGPDAPMKRLDTTKEGVYCCFEGVIVGHESESWAKYLISTEKESQKRKKYLEDFLSGKIPRN